MSKIPKKSKDKRNIEHQKYISRITKTLYYGKFPKPVGLSLPVTELAADLFSEAQRGRSLDRLHCDDAANISRNACVSPCSLVIAILYLERLKKTCPEYIERTASSDLFLVSLMVSCKFLYDDGEADEVFINEWALSGGTTVKHLVQLEKDFLNAIDWKVFVNELTFWKKLDEIERALARKEGTTRGFFTYTELETLLTTFELQNLIQNILAASVILIACYAAALLALFGSVLIVSYIPGSGLQPKRIDVADNKTIVTINHEPIQDEFCNTVESNVLHKLNKMESEINLKNEIKTVNVLKTSIFLASIESFMKPFCDKSNITDMKGKTVENVQNVSWDWWTTPTLKWLSETTAIITKVQIPKLEFLYFRHVYETYDNIKYLDLEDQIHKPSKTRIQDQLENSWHKEWIDTIEDGNYNRYLQYYVQNIKS